MHNEDTEVTIYENAIPEFAERDLERLYQNPYSTLAHHRLHRGLGAGTNTYVVRKGDEAKAVLLFRREGDQVRVINEQLRIDADEVARFARHVFDRERSVNRIAFHAVETEARRLPFPHQAFSCTEDIVLKLPHCEDEYRARMGRSTRSYITRYLKKLRRDFPSLRHEVVLAGDVSEQQVRSIIALNTARMSEKNRESYIDEEETRRIVHFAKTCGLVSLVTIDGRLCAGAINFRFGDNYFLKVIAHDPAYNDYRLGTLCCYLSICECIARGGSEYHFLWGRYDYKYRLLGVQRDLDHVTLYRSRMRMLLSGGTVMRNALAGLRLRLKRVVLHLQKRPGKLGASLRFLASAVHRLRGSRHARPPPGTVA